MEDETAVQGTGMHGGPSHRGADDDAGLTWLGQQSIVENGTRVLALYNEGTERQTESRFAR